MIDLFSRGRLIAGFPVGTRDGHGVLVQRQPEPRCGPKYYEGIELIMKAWQATEPFAFNGRFNQHALRQPRAAPVAASRTRRCGSPAAVRSRRGTSAPRTTSSTAPSPTTATRWSARPSADTGAGSRPTARTTTRTASPSPSSSASPTPTPRPTSCTASRPSTSSTARCTCTRASPIRPATSPRRRCAPATSRRSARRSRAKQAKHDLTWDEMVDNGYVVIGSPDTVREQLEEACKELRIGHLCAMLQFGNMSDELTRYNTRAVRREGRSRTAHDVRRVRRPVVARKCPLRCVSSDSSTCSGSPATRRSRRRCALVEADGWEIVVPSVPGSTASRGFVATRRVPRLAHGVLGRASTPPARCRARWSARRSAG